MTQTNEELIEEFKNHLDYYKDLKGKWEFLKTPEDRAFHAGKTQGMLLGLEVIERISIPQPEQKECKWKQWSEGDTFDTDCDNCFSLIEGSIEENNFKHCPYCGKLIKVVNEEKE